MAMNMADISGTSAISPAGSVPAIASATMDAPVVRMTRASTNDVWRRFQTRNPYSRVRLTQMTRKGTVDQAPISRIPSRFTPTNTAHTMSTHDDRTQRTLPR